MISGNDVLSQWVKNNLANILFDSYEQNLQFWDMYQKVINYIQSSGFYKNPGLLEWMKETKADPQLIAMAKVYNLSIVTFEQSAGRLSIKNPIKKEPKIPDVAKYFGVSCIDLYDLETKLRNGYLKLYVLGSSLLVN